MLNTVSSLTSFELRRRDFLVWREYASREDIESVLETRGIVAKNCYEEICGVQDRQSVFDAGMIKERNRAGCDTSDLRAQATKM